ncbi:MAG: YebW family protein [Rouxiella aceris]|uniref:YebW family protein n=1 Tax=Rouxiella aceris TaxID=2703884 RepID=UPI00283CE423|nr:YebW family protein [Rouxiella aceris]MDR3432006.1 YebW family protein [Rouxiella aceris]
MFALVLTVCYLGGGCEELVVDAFNSIQECRVAMRQQGLRQAGCYPIEDFIDGYWIPAYQQHDF